MKKLALTTVLASLVLGSGPCGPVSLPENALDELFKGDPATLCPKWIETVTDIYIKKMECSATDSSLSLHREEVKFLGHRYFPVVVRYTSDPPTDLLRLSMHSGSLESMLAPLVGAERVFRDAETGRPLDLFDRPLLGQLILGDDQVVLPPPAVLVAVDRVVGLAKAEHARRRALFPREDWAGNNPAIAQLDHNGPVQQALLPLARALAEKCAGQLYPAHMLAQLAANPGCERALPIDPFLRALFGEARTGQAVSLQKQAEAEKKPWWRRFVPEPTIGPPAPPPKRSGGAHGAH